MVQGKRIGDDEAKQVALGVLKRYEYYEMKHRAMDFEISTPPGMEWVQSVLGWCAKAVDSLADRLVFRSLKDDGADLMGIFEMNSPDILFDSAIRSALISSCCFVYVSPDGGGFPRLQVIDGANATGVLDPITNLLTEGYAVLERDDCGNAIGKAYFTPDRTLYLRKGSQNAANEDALSIPNASGYPMLVPVIYSPDARRWFGHSRISRACMSLQDAAARTAKRSEVSAEFYSYPQKWVTGLSQDHEGMDKWRATMASMLAFTKDDEHDSPKVGQFAQQSMGPHVEQLKMFASLFAGETGLTLDDLGFSTGNPSSADAIKSQHENLRLAARRAQRDFSVGILNVGMVAACVRDRAHYERKAFYRTTVRWEPVFEPDSSMLAGIGDAALKLNQSAPGYLDTDSLEDMTGIHAAAGTGNAIPLETLAVGTGSGTPAE